MATILVTSKGVATPIGHELGRGGEGTVYEVPSLNSQVAKLYNHSHLPDLKKQAKLSFMCSAVDQELLDYVAWPLETLHPTKGGPVVGFLMPKVTGRDPVHMVYSPAHRKQDRPKVAWDFLLYVARNTAAAFEALHSHGHVLGDVNQGNVMVGNDSKVILIDSDSFQINAKGSQHFCEVGVAHFTPPELQGLSSFKGFTRTANHDNFGLALLIYHLLYGGRHPFSGVPQRKGVGESLEGDIKAYRFAYAKDAQSRGIAPPPLSIPLNLVPDSVASMFEVAFTEKGSSGLRPTAHQWKSVLDGIRSRLKKCSVSPMHVFSDHLGSCPWCALEKQAVYYFVDLGTTFTASSGNFVFTQVWALIEAVQAPQPIPVPVISSIHVTPLPLPAGISGSTSIAFYRFIVVAVAVAAIALMPKAWWLIAIGGWIGWSLTGASGSSQRAAERKSRKSVEEQARREFDTLIQRAKIDVGPEGFFRKKDELRTVRDEFQALAAEEAKELERLKSTAQERQKLKFLESFFIDGADISGVGPTRKATLRSFGIETAADISKRRILQVRGFGDGLTRALTDWRASCERRFVFNPATAVTEADKNVVRAKIASRRAVLVNTLSAGPGELQRVRQLALSRSAAYKSQIEQAAKKLAQAQRDRELVD